MYQCNTSTKYLVYAYSSRSNGNTGGFSSPHDWPLIVEHPSTDQHEALACLRLLASSATPEYLSLYRINALCTAAPTASQERRVPRSEQTVCLHSPGNKKQHVRPGRALAGIRQKRATQATKGSQTYCIIIIDKHLLHGTWNLVSGVTNTWNLVSQMGKAGANACLWY